MGVLEAGFGQLSTLYPEAKEVESDPERMDALYNTIAKMPTIAAMSYKYSIGMPFMYPDNSLDYSSNFLHMMFATPCEDYEVNPVLAKAVDLLLILHADHEQNCSTTATRVVGSSAFSSSRKHANSRSNNSARSAASRPRRSQAATSRR